MNTIEVVNNSEFLAQFRHQYKKAYIMSVLELISVLLFVFFAVWLGMLLEYRIFVWWLLLPAVYGVLQLVFVTRYKKRQTAPELYCVRSEFSATKDIITRLNVTEYGVGKHGGILLFDDAQVRVTLIESDVFDNSITKRRKQINQKINQQFGHTKYIPFYEQNKHFRINIVFMEESDEKLLKWIKSNTDHLLSRVEGIMNVGICLNDQCVIIPAPISVSSIGALVKYKKMIQFVRTNLI